MSDKEGNHNVLEEQDIALMNLSFTVNPGLERIPYQIWVEMRRAEYLVIKEMEAFSGKRCHNLIINCERSYIQLTEDGKWKIKEMKQWRMTTLKHWREAILQENEVKKTYNHWTLVELYQQCFQELMDNMPLSTMKKMSPYHSMNDDKYIEEARLEFYSRVVNWAMMSEA